MVEKKTNQTNNYLCYFTTIKLFSAQKRMTWSMINKQDQLNASKDAYSNQKYKITQDFGKIKTKVKKKKESLSLNSTYLISLHPFMTKVVNTLKF